MLLLLLKTFESQMIKLNTQSSNLNLIIKNKHIFLKFCWMKKYLNYLYFVLQFNIEDCD